MLEFTNSKGFVAQYYNGLTGEIHACPSYVKEEHEEYMQWYTRLTGVQQIRKSHEDSISESPAAKILVFTSEPEKFITDCTEQFSQQHPQHCDDSITSHEFPFHMINGAPHNFVEFLRPGVSKGHGCQKLCPYMNVNMSEMIAFGDGENDKVSLLVSKFTCK